MTKFNFSLSSKIDDPDIFAKVDDQFLGIKKVEKISDSKLKKIVNKLKKKGIEEKEILSIVDNINTEKHLGYQESITFENPLYPIFNKERERTSWYLAGVNGSGKTYYASFILKSYRENYPRGQVILFSQKPDDKTLDKFNVLRIKLDEKLIKYPFQLNEFKENSLIIFDDIDSIGNKHLQKAINNLIDEILKVGRSKRINCIITQHIATSGVQTRNMVNEASYITLFPNAGNVHHLNYFLKNYIGLTKKQINELPENSRWVTFHQGYPSYYFFETGAKILLRKK